MWQFDHLLISSMKEIMRLLTPPPTVFPSIFHPSCLLSYWGWEWFFPWHGAIGRVRMFDVRLVHVALTSVVYSDVIGLSSPSFKPFSHCPGFRDIVLQLHWMSQSWGKLLFWDLSVWIYLQMSLAFSFSAFQLSQFFRGTKRLRRTAWRLDSNQYEILWNRYVWLLHFVQHKPDSTLVFLLESPSLC